MRSHSLKPPVPASMRAGHPLVDDAGFEQLRLLAARLRARRHATGREAGVHSSHQRGPGMDLHDSRPYQPGDDVRHMDWRATARSGRATSKVFIAERRRDAHLFVDRRPAMMFGTRRELKAATAARVAALLAFQALAAQGAVGGWVLDRSVRHFALRGTIPGALPLLRAAAEPAWRAGWADAGSPTQRNSRRPEGERFPGPCDARDGVARAAMDGEKRVLESAPPPASCHCSPTLGFLRQPNLRSGALYLISDFNDVIAGTATFADYLPEAYVAGGAIEVVAVRIVDEAELRMVPAGVLQLVPPEGGAPVLVDTDDPALRQRYELHAAQRGEALAAECALRGVALFSVGNCQDLAPQVESLP